VGTVDVGGLRMTPMPTQSDHLRGINMAGTRDSVTRHERSRAIVAKDARSTEDEDMAQKRNGNQTLY
jgi:hypothetical protein